MREPGFGGRGGQGGPGRAPGRGGHGGRTGGRRGSRGDVRTAILALLAERPMHGYEMLTELARRTGEVWRPSPGSLYPALQLLEDQGLVPPGGGGGRPALAPAPNGGGAPPWETIVGTADDEVLALRGALRDVELAVSQVAEAGTPAQRA